MKRPVSVISPTYRASAIRGVAATPSPCIRSQTISAVHDASGSTRLTVPKRVLSWWWSMLRMCMPGRRNASAGLRSRLPQSRNTAVRSSRSWGGELRTSSSPRKRYSWGSGNSRASMNAGLSLPRAVRISRIATSEPSASPSGFSWVTTISLLAERSSSSACSRLERFPFSGTWTAVHVGPTIEQFGEPSRALHRLVVLEFERGGVLELQLARQSSLEEAMGRTQALEAGGSTRLVSEHAHIHARVAEISAGLHGSHSHESDSGILQVRGDRVAEHLAHRLIDATHSSASHPIPPLIKETETPLKARRSWLEVLHRGDRPLD